MKKFIFPGLLIVLAFVAGLWGALWALSLTSNGTPITLLNPELDLSGQKTVVINDARKVVVNQDLRLQELSTSLSSSFVGIFRAGGTINNDLDNYYHPEKVLSLAWPISSDGWLLVNQSPVSEISQDIFSNYKNFRGIIKNRQQVYEIDKVFFPKNNSPFILVHLAGVNDLPVREFASPLDLSSGQMFLQTSFTGEMRINYLSSPILGSKIRSADPLGRRLETSWLPEKDLGSFIFDLRGFLVAFRGGDGQYVLAHDYYPWLKDFFRQNSWSRPVFGANYYELSSLIKKDPNSRSWRKGAYLSAVNKNSLAEKAGFMVGDVIVSLNGQELGESYDLGELLKDYKNGDKLNFVYLRQAESRELSVIFEIN